VTDVSVGGRVLGISPAAVRRAVLTVLRRERRQAVVSVTFLGPTAMRQMNRKHKTHDRPTDVLAFALGLPGGRLAGDVYVCRAVAAAQAKEAGVGLKEELVRLVVHGVLHVLGHDHPDRNREGSPMWRRQERYVRAVLGGE
jgi:probable rRNA maturation factor